MIDDQPRMNWPVCLPDSFPGEGNFDEWIAHFETVATLNGWTGAEKLNWMIVRLTGRAQTAFRRFPPETQESYEDAVKALRERFDPPARKDLYAAELQARRKEKSESWGDFGDAIKTLVDRAFPSLEPAAKEVIALNHYLSHVGNPQVEFAVKQHRPKSLVEAVSCTIEAECYLPKPTRVSCVELEDSVPTPPSQELSVAVVQRQQGAMMGILEGITKHLENLEERLSTTRVSQGTFSSRVEGVTSKESTRPPVICHKCKQEGHYARGCATNRSRGQGN